jgi:hypothetical protein
VHDEAEAPEGALTVEAPHEVGGDFDAFLCDREDEFAGVQDERVVAVDGFELGEVRHLELGVDDGQAVVTKDAELAAEAQVNAGGLEEALLPWLDDEPAGGDFLADAAVAED